MKRFLNAAEETVSAFSWKEITLFKICVAAVGVLLGLMVPARSRKGAAWAASLVFVATYIPLMSCFLPRLLGDRVDFENLYD